MPKYKQDIPILASTFEQKGQKSSQLTRRHTTSSTGCVTMAIMQGLKIIVDNNDTRHHKRVRSYQRL